MLIPILLELVGVFCASTAVLFIKLSQLHPILLAAYRVLIAASVLTPRFVKELRRHPDLHLRAQDLFQIGLAPGFALALHFISWIIGARLTPAANATLVVTLTPVVMPFLLAVMIQEHLTTGERWGTLFAVGGVFLLSAGDFNFSREYFWGDIICLISMLFYSYYMALSRKNRRIPSIWLYVVPVYWIAGIVSLACALVFVNPIHQPYSWREIWLLLALSLIPTVIGHSIINYVMQVLRGQLVSLINLSQFLFAGVMAYIFLGEIPQSTFYASAALILAGVLLSLRK